VSRWTSSFGSEEGTLNGRHDLVPDVLPGPLRAPRAGVVAPTPAAPVSLLRSTGNAALSGLMGAAELDVSLKDDAVLARAVVDGELGILRQWRDALSMFDKTMVSESDKAGEPEFQKVVLSFFADQVIDGLFKLTEVPGLPKGVPQPGKAIHGLLQKLEAEYKRAAAARASARLRDFVNQHLADIAEIDRQLTLAKDDFETAVDLAGAKVGADAAANADYGLVRLWLVDEFRDVERRLSASDSSSLFTTLSEQWIRSSTVPIGMGHRTRARVIIRLEEDFTLRNGHIQGTGGQKLAEQLLKNHPGGVDLARLAVPRTIIRYARNGWPRDILRLDEEGRRDDLFNYAEGNPSLVHEWVRRHGLPTVTRITGD
jgi:hypothetical protein